MLLTSHMGVAIASGMSKNSSWDRPDAVAPVSSLLPKLVGTFAHTFYNRS